MDGNVDPAVLASLPPSMQLDLLVRVTNDIDSISSQYVELQSRFSLFDNFVTRR